ncbi:MAG: hypothetical protein ABSG03_22035 [Bryobacteraceae bacterium]
MLREGKLVCASPSVSQQDAVQIAGGGVRSTAVGSGLNGKVSIEIYFNTVSGSIRTERFP